jgi:tetratricopeptide (TPR) repeat protein
MYSCCMITRFSLFIVILVATAAFPGTTPKKFEQIAKQADEARAADRVNDAINLYKDGIHLRPAWGEGWWSLGSLLYDQDRFPEAELAFRHFVAITPKPGPAYAFLGLCEYENRDYDRALRHFRDWARIGWAGTRQLIDVSVFHFALLLTREGKFVEALYLLATEAGKVGETPTLSEAMGLASLRMRNVPEDYPPERREMVWLAGKAALYASQSPPDFQRADEYSDRLLSHYNGQPEVHYFRGTIFTFEDKRTEAKEEFKAELRISPQHVPATLGVARIDIDEDQLAEAEHLAKRSTDLDPQDPEAHHLLGRVLLATGRYLESARELEVAKQLAPGSATVRSHLAMAYNHLGREKEANVEASAFMALKNKEEILAPPQEKLKLNPHPGQPR